MNKKIGIIGQFPPPMHGLSKALDTLYNSYLNVKYDFIKIDITNNKKILKNIFKVFFSNLDLYYLTISQSKFGNIRDLIIIKLIQLKGKKIIIHLHGGGFRNILDTEFSKIQRKLNYNILSKVEGCIVLGESLKYIFQGIIPDEKIYIVKNCVDNEFVIDEQEFDHKMNELDNKQQYKILYLSNFIEDKGYKEVLELANLARKNGYDKLKFVFAGKFFNKDDECEFFEFINKYKLNSIIEYRGVVGGQDKLQLLKESDIFILLTRYKNEGQPISIIEAAVNGIKIISTNHAGIKDILSEDEMIIVNKDSIDIEEIYYMIIDYIENIKTTNLRVNRNKALIEFSQENYLNNLDNILQII